MTTLWKIHGEPCKKWVQSQWFYGVVIDEKYNTVDTLCCWRAYKVEIIKNNERMMPFGPGFKTPDLQEQLFAEEEFRAWDDSHRRDFNR